MFRDAREIRFQHIPAGEFRMGGSDEDKFVTAVELPARPVRIAAFSISAYPVTIHQWNTHTGASLGGHPDWPVTRVSFDEAWAFAVALDARLPSEAEWEYACRASSLSIFPQGGTLCPQDANFLYDESGEPVGRGEPCPVGSHPPNAFGLHDMIGNVCEWTADHWHASYQNAPGDESPWLDSGGSERRVIRGGGWDHLPRLLRASWRDWAHESARWDNLGFRLARDLSS